MMISHTSGYPRLTKVSVLIGVLTVSLIGYLSLQSNTISHQKSFLTVYRNESRTHTSKLLEIYKISAEDVGFLQTQRKQRIKKVCASLPSSDMERDSRSNYSYRNVQGHGRFATPRVNMEIPVIMLAMAKCGTTNLLTLLGSALGVPKTAMETTYRYRLTRELSNSEVQKLITRDKKLSSPVNFLFTTIRNPWTRLVSVWTQKFIDHFSLRASMSHIPLQWMEYARNQVKTGKGLTFPVFIEKCVLHQWLNGEPYAMDIHWRPESVMGAFCSVDYDYIGAIESMDVDEPVIASHFGYAGNVSQLLANNYKLRRLSEKKKSTKLTYSQAWKSIPSENINLLQKIYQVDFIMFDYPDHPMDT